jgi:hypothetical protein
MVLDDSQLLVYADTYAIRLAAKSHSLPARTHIMYVAFFPTEGRNHGNSIDLVNWRDTFDFVALVLYYPRC